MADKKIGKITHYYDKLGVAIIKLANGLSVGDKIKIAGHGNELVQDVSSIQLEHEKLQKAKKGQLVGVKVDKVVKDGDEVTKV
ncbi:hypothetical protein A3G67_04400 [Candidatus Roizmanbacteria bacterium RIFCSPLOWO2_12_FULL_40_12]|uniref:Translation elongation factor-like protein n=1 Tax=Candidatus Roizmanbacteria bacterium RIFCSPLOWO2_01_FULL_40_42 TaxID=1802066 RepID=A0A1F7J4T4_9BACT|nr:MAG: hypothetical protein A2779_04750 [Candidatus Roizmanbacteria bacterium RIFCSPHIGHO2_01_FULL_40_98]OGK27382.1 MAG: hypothetical protein A3C31_05075 [Candidatus Roizmanbacteria bacterium RIFCSPHIGHO2_02_FULL_40_53]OGK30746.1 MAG: hypothetical protein A2W49_01965 [Candidatus Roizmanbacteria bacterium RIFCSPHIGHO2_12_41_18]OGK36487.1 MAG: hypothetical protein A3E69_02700 [Candidatus Roizmanbacteria bacterium RIFCSPHIGHO2_12_FULL_40_130]OGK50615.1 MAG: hypothetical protein A3B50_02430 [Candi